MNSKKKKRKEKADERLAARSKLTAQQQLDRLDKLLGVGQGASKERARLTAEINDSQ